MTTQLEMLPMTREEIAEAFLAHFEDEVEKRTKSMITAQGKLAEALKLREMAEHEVHRARGRSVSQVAADIVNSGALDTEDIQVTASVSPAVDPITGEVTSKAAEPNVSVVIVLYPGSDEPVVTKIGEHTRYGELVADYFTSQGVGDKTVDADEWTVVAEDELTQDGRGYRSLHDVITGADYGKRLLVVAADQGSVTGGAAAEEPAA